MEATRENRGVGRRPLGRGSRYAVATAVVLVALGLLRPLPPPEVEPAPGRPFRWDADLLFAELAEQFERARGMEAVALEASLGALEARGRASIAAIRDAPDVPIDELGVLANLQFQMAVRGAAEPALLPRVADFVIDARVATMRAAAGWPTGRALHDGLYRVVFGGRMALDEAIVQAGGDALPPLIRFEEVGSAAPSVVVEGVRVHSGDILLSRGGAPTSAFIARGNDYPNTFSHAALVHVDAESGRATVIESLIEAGSVLTTPEEYLTGKKHRILVLRLPPEHPAVAADPMLPHRAAEAMLARVRAGHIPYDFAMRWDDGSEVFCSEIVFHPFRDLGVELWSIRSAMSAPGLVRWLADMGVRTFTTLVPSDIEFDPQVRAVAEWRDVDALMDFRIDNAIIDVLLEEAERGGSLGNPWYALPGARALKAYSVARSALGGEAPIPDGMDARAALRVNALVNEVHPALRAELVERSARSRAERGYEVPYWTLVELARASLEARREALVPSLLPPE